MFANNILRPKSACRMRESYNPILPLEQPIVHEKSGRAKVNPTFFYSKYPEERPKGKVQSEFSKNSHSTFHISSEENVNYRPSIRVNIPNTAIHYDRPQSIRVAGYAQNRDPVIQERSARTKTRGGSPSPILKYENEKKYFLPADIGGRTTPCKNTESKVFENACESYLFNGKIKNLLSKPSEISSVIGYEYALPYREQKVTVKV